MTDSTEPVCCPPFDPAQWDGKEFVWQEKLFVQDRVRCLFHIPLNFGAVMTRNLSRIEAVDALSSDRLTLSDESSLWSSNLYIAVTKPVAGAKMTSLSGTFHCRVFEGPYRDIGRWIAQMKSELAGRGQRFKCLWFWYTTCPKCAKKYGRNYVAILAQE